MQWVIGIFVSLDTNDGELDIVEMFFSRLQDKSVRRDENVRMI